ncbi:MAG: twin-arginine translocase subunit TatC [Actinomycetota bacterium]
MTEREMTFLEHLDELRKRIIVSAVALVIGTAICYVFFKPLLEFAKWPLPSHLKLAPLTVFSFMQMFLIRFKMAVIGGFIITSPLIIYEILAFFAPGLKKNEKRYLFTLLPFMVILFIGGAAFSFFLVLPAAIQWLYSQGMGQISFINRADDYISFVSLMVLAFGVAFEAPLVVLLLIKLGIVDRKTLRKNWRIAYVVSFIVAAIATPDWSIVSMSMLGVALVLLFEISLFLARWL